MTDQNFNDELYEYLCELLKKRKIAPQNALAMYLGISYKKLSKILKKEHATAELYLYLSRFQEKGDLLIFLQTLSEFKFQLKKIRRTMKGQDVDPLHEELTKIQKLIDLEYEKAKETK